MKRIITTGAIVLGSLMSINAMSQDLSMEDAQDAVTKRQSVFQLLSFSNSPLGQMARGGEFNEEAAIEATERVAMLAEFIPEVFAVDTSGVDGLETRAFDTIWENKDELDQLAMDLRDGAMAAKEILENQGASGVRDAVQQIGPKCGACHDRFRMD